MASLPTVEDSKDIDEKSMLKSITESALFYLQRSLAIMIKSAISRLCGTKATLQRLHEINSKLQCLPESSAKKSELTVELNKLVSTSCKFWNDDCSVDEDWVWNCRKVLPRKTNDPQEEWKDLSEDMKSWKLDTCLKFINRAGFKITDHKTVKLVNCLEHDGVHLFSSEHMCFKTDSNTKYKFVEFADKTRKVRNYYAHPPPYKDMIEKYLEYFIVTKEFATMILDWVEHEDGDLQYVSICQENIKEIEQKSRCYLEKHTAKWDAVLLGLRNLDFNNFSYTLVSTPCSSRTGVAVSVEELGQLSNIPWDTVVDFDVYSREDGLWYSLCAQKGDQYRLKTPCQFTNKVVVPFSYTDIDGAERRELCRNGRIPWIFPHGEVHNKTNEACPLNDYTRYYTQIQKPLIAAMRKVTAYIAQNKSEGVVSVILCYGSYACASERLPYENFFSDLKYLCGELKYSDGHVIILSDNLHLEEILKPFPVFIFPLDTFCKMIQDKLHVEQGNLLPVRMPSLINEERILRPITFDEEDFELIHEHIAEHEIVKLLEQEKTHLRQQSNLKTVSDNILRSDVKYKLRENFYKGNRVTWISLNADHTITRREEDKIIIRM